MSVVTMKQLLEAGVHFGHQAKRWNPKMKKYIFTERNGIHVIDLHKSLKKIEEAYEEMRKIAEFLKDRDFEKKISEDKDTEKHLTWLKAFINKYPNIENLSVDEILENILNVEIGLTFSRVLEDAGVFKRDEKGKNAFLKFINHIGGRF